jgi:hypothetical protein
MLWSGENSLASARNQTLSTPPVACHNIERAVPASSDLFKGEGKVN